MAGSVPVPARVASRSVPSVGLGSSSVALRTSDGGILEDTLERAVAAWVNSRDRVLAVPADWSTAYERVFAALWSQRVLVPFDDRSGPPPPQVLVDAGRVAIVGSP